MLTVNLADRLEDFTKFFLTSTFLLCLEVFVSRPRYLILHKFQKSCSNYCKRGKITFPTILPGSQLRSCNLDSDQKINKRKPYKCIHINIYT